MYVANNVSQVHKFGILIPKAANTDILFVVWTVNYYFRVYIMSFFSNRFKMLELSEV